VAKRSTTPAPGSPLHQDTPERDQVVGPSIIPPRVSMESSLDGELVFTPDTTQPRSQPQLQPATQLAQKSRPRVEVETGVGAGDFKPNLLTREEPKAAPSPDLVTQSPPKSSHRRRIGKRIYRKLVVGEIGTSVVDEEVQLAGETKSSTSSMTPTNKFSTIEGRDDVS
jgi:hypothetical protein